jgi:hypothetical protein
MLGARPSQKDPGYEDDLLLDYEFTIPAWFIPRNYPNRMVVARKTERVHLSSLKLSLNSIDTLK